MTDFLIGHCYLKSKNKRTIIIKDGIRLMTLISFIFSKLERAIAMRITPPTALNSTKSSSVNTFPKVEAMITKILV